MKFDFDTRVERDGYGSLRQIICPEQILRAGLVSYAGAEMDFPTAPSVVRSIVRRAEKGAPGFCLCDEPYKEAVCWWMKTQRGLTIEKDWIVTTQGTIFTLATLIRLFTKSGESIIIQPPVYNRYEQAARRLGRNTLRNKLVFNGTSYEMNFDDLETLMARPDAKIFVLCNPHNPTGNVWGVNDLQKIAALAKKHGVFVYSDEIFSEVCFDGLCPSYLTIPNTDDNSVTVTSIGKCFNFTGVNHANVLIRDKALRERFRAQRDADHYGSIDPWAYSAIMGAYCQEGADWKNAMLKYVSENIGLVEDFFRSTLPAVRWTPCQGSFVMWVDWSGLGMSEEELLQFLTNDALLDVSPGEEYYEDRPCLTRLSVAVPRSDLNRSLQLLKAAAEKRGLCVYSAASQG